MDTLNSHLLCLIFRQIQNTQKNSHSLNFEQNKRDVEDDAKFSAYFQQLIFCGDPKRVLNSQKSIVDGSFQFCRDYIAFAFDIDRKISQSQ